MRKLFNLSIFTLLLLLSNNLYALPREKCTEIAADAKTEWGFRLIFGFCLREDSYFFNRSKEFKCAVKAGRAGTETAAKMIFSECMY